MQHYCHFIYSELIAQFKKRGSFLQETFAKEELTFLSA